MALGERNMHDLLTHLTSILLGLQMLRRDLTSERERRIADQALESAEALRSQVMEQLATRHGQQSWPDQRQRRLVSRAPGLAAGHGHEAHYPSRPRAGREGSEPSHSAN